MKRYGLVALALVAAVSLGLVGCGCSEKKATEAKPAAGAADMMKYKCEKCQKDGTAKKGDPAPQC